MLFSFQTGKMKIKDIPGPDQIAIFDQTLCCMVTWLEGHSLAQTVFTNLYLHRPMLVEDRFTKATSIVFLKLIDLIKDVLSRS